MSPAVAMALIAVLGVLLALASAAAGALWWRGRSLPLAEAVRLAEALAAQQRTLEALRARLGGGGALEPVDPGVRPAPPGPSWLAEGGTGLTVRLDRKGTGAGGGPMLIAVPDLTGPPAETTAAAELTRRFRAIWDLADAGASAGAIARGTGQPIGQVELILGLRRQLATAEGRA